MQRRVANRVATLLSHLEPAAPAMIEALLCEDEATQTLNYLRTNSYWAELADPNEIDDLRGWVDMNPEAGTAMREFEEWGLRHDRYVIHIAMRRILAPLVSHYRTDGALLSWNDLSPTKQARLIKCGIEREQIILGDMPLVQRLTEIAVQNRINLDELRAFFGGCTPHDTADSKVHGRDLQRLLSEEEHAIEEMPAEKRTVPGAGKKHIKRIAEAPSGDEAEAIISRILGPDSDYAPWTEQ